MESHIEALSLEIKDYMPPECTCKIEDIVKKNPHVVDASFNPISNLLTVKAHKGMLTAEDIKKILKECGYRCEKGRTPHEQAHMEHEAMKVKKHEHDHHAMMEAEMKRRFVFSLLFAIPVLVLSPTIQEWLGFEIPEFTGSDYLLFVLATVVVVYGGLVFYRGAYRSLKNGILDMNVLVSIAVIAGYLYSVGSTFLYVAVGFYWEISTLVVFLLFGHWMEMKAVRGASGALKELVKLIPPTANLLKDGEVVEVPTSEVKVGDVLLVRPGEKVPIDGIVMEGETNVNESMITGESKPVHKKEMQEVIGGTINGEGSIKVKVNKVGEDTALSQIINLVKEAQASKPKTQKLADRAAHYLTLIAIIVGISTFVFWKGIVGEETVFALTLTITVIVITCPHALGLAIPTVTSISTTLAAKNGILIKSADATELAKEVQTIVFDKTGTLTKGEFGVTDLVKAGDWEEEKILRRAASIEVNSEHTIAKGIVNRAKEKGIKIEKAKGFNAIPGKGAKATINGEEIFIGNTALMDEMNIPLQDFKEKISSLASQGKTVVYLATKEGLKGILALTDIIREESREAVKALKDMGIEVAMLTGDNKQTAEYVAKELDLDNFFAEVLPEDKSRKIEELQRQGKIVAMVGDGINDAPALVQANVGIAIGAGTDVAVESAEGILVKNDPRDVVKLIKLSRKTMRKMKENLVWATGYNAGAIPLAAGVLFPFGVVLRPEWAALIMAASSIIVVANALLLRRIKL